ncbi:tyrosine-type recombinase/integrase [Aquabacterium sp.]|uniref:tyrosine-type recombinase/integrase n=1 Tax=Aquabacterium sp. TaxID=1872578 RepID=UPI0035B0A077
MPLTDTAVRNAKPTDKAVKMFDGGGLYLEVSPSGGKWWRLKYRYGGKEKRLSLGTYPDVGLKDARDRRDQARKTLADGIDPGEVRKTEKAAKKAATLRTFEAVANAWMTKSADDWDDGTHAKVRASLENHVFPTIGGMPIADVRPADVRELVQQVEASGARETAGRVFQRIRAVYRYAVAHELTDADPTYPLKPAEILKRQTVTHRAALSERDVPAFLRDLDAYQGDSGTRSALRLLMLTAVRPGELRGALWEEIDQTRALWRIPAERMKMKTEHTVPLSRQAMELLASLNPDGEAHGLVFPSPFYPGKPISDGTLNSALARMGYKGTATAHGFRTLFSTCANEAGWPSDVIEKQLAHEERDGVRGAYNRASWMAERTKLMQWWADHLDALAKGAKVIPLKTA